LPLQAIATTGRLTQVQGTTSTLEFRDTEYVAAAPPPALLFPRDVDFEPVPLVDADPTDPWSNPPTGLSGSLLAPDGSRVPVLLRPLGSTLLRIAGFRSDEVFDDGFDA